MLLLISLALAALAFSCGAYVGKGKALGGMQVVILWSWVVLLTPSTAYLYWVGGPAVILAVFLLFCLAEILALLLFCSRDNSPSKGEKELLERLQKRD
ncbi:MAG TPA: hypothetical protein PLC15_03290 [Candidatus Obscuribacter sp.]|nr:hypothetical protein [Candidatus Obscuribacter sp.]MBK9280593.1 hypothetical protein [Candidatus Obscuribacter sp.]MBL8084358.1 hypothetical protein [Candidatus Obscuribacter sp.]HMW88467.1 hypothetical protein [Candidatus Obscuribacter sp.]HMY03077.1 hypothetical protein [Candidatus Obscuribacter sp.]